MEWLQTLRREVAILAGNKDAVLALCLFNGWVFAFNWSALFELPLPPSLSGFAGNGLWLLSLVMCTAALGVFFAVRRLYSHISARMSWVAATLMVASVVLLVAADTMEARCPSGGFPVVLSVAGGVASGLGTGLLSCCLGALAVRFSPSVLLQILAASLVFSAVLVMVESLLPSSLAVLLLCAVALGCALSFSRAFGAGTSGLDRNEGHAFTGAPFLGLVFLFGVSGGLLRGLIGVEAQSTLGIGAFALATFVAACALLFSKLPDYGEPFSLFYRVVAVIAGGFMMLGLFADRTELALAIHSAGFTYFYGLMWALCCLYAVEGRFPVRIFVGGLLFNQVGQIVGAFVGVATVQAMGGPSFAAVSNVVVYVLLFVSVAMLAKLSRPSTATPPAPPYARPAGSQPSSLTEACDRAAERFGMTQRESEVLFLLVRGYDRGYVAQELGLSTETVKTHTRHIYEKVGVHTRTELLGVILGV